MDKERVPYSLIALLGGTTRQNVHKIVKQKKDVTKWLQNRIVKISMVKPSSNKYTFVYDHYVKQEMRNGLIKHCTKVKNTLIELGVSEDGRSSKVRAGVGKRIKWDLNKLYVYIFGCTYQGKNPLTLLGILYEFIKIVKEDALDCLISKYINSYRQKEGKLPEFTELFKELKLRLLGIKNPGPRKKKRPPELILPTEESMFMSTMMDVLNS